jgi:hypothetical protein
MNRQRLPNRRASETFELEVGGLKYTATFPDSLMGGSESCSYPITNRTAPPTPTPAIPQSCSRSRFNVGPIQKRFAALFAEILRAVHPGRLGPRSI